ncbi:MAG: aspartyl protease family protein [Planctomycetota bacterium]
MDSPRSPVSPSWEVAAGDPALDHAHAPRSSDECSFREACPFAIGLFLVLVVAITLLVTSLAWAGSARAQTGLDAVPIGGFQPWVAFTLTNEFSNENQDDLFFVADVDSTFNPSRSLPNAGTPIYEIGLLDSGSQVNLLTDDATTAFDVVGQGFGGTELIEAVGVSGSEFLTVQDPLGIFTAGLQHVIPNASNTGVFIPAANDEVLRGLKSNAPASAPAGSVLPNVIGLPMMSTHTTVIRNSQPQFVEDGDETFRAPSVEFLPLGDPIPSDFSRRAALGLEVNATFGTTEPLYVFNVGNAISGDPLHENPSTPTAVGGAFFTDIDIANAGTTRTAEVFFDTGAQVSVVNELLAAQLGFDVVNDTPDFTVPIIGVGGAQTDIPGFIADSLTVPAVGGNFTATNVPIVVLENVPNPLGAGILDGILGTNVFWDRDLVIDPAGDRLWISDSVTTEVSWDGGADDYDNGLKWSVDRRPIVTDVVTIQGSAVVDMDTDAQVYRMLVGGSAAATPSVLDVGIRKLEVFTDLQIEQNGTVQAFEPGVVSTQQINIGAGGTLAGAGTFIGDTITNAGVVRPLQGDALKIIGTYQQEASGTFQYGDVALQVDGAAILDGTLELGIWGSAPDVYGEPIVILQADSVAGEFSTIIDRVDDAFGWVVSYLADSVEVTVALIGDANLNQQVEQGDLNAVLTNWGQTGQVWASGDFNGDGFVDQTDLNAVLTNWGASAPPSFAGFTVPEPAAVLGLLFAAAGLSRRRLAA